VHCHRCWSRELLLVLPFLLLCFPCCWHCSCRLAASCQSAVQDMTSFGPMSCHWVRPSTFLSQTCGSKSLPMHLNACMSFHVSGLVHCAYANNPLSNLHFCLRLTFLAHVAIDFNFHACTYLWHAACLEQHLASALLQCRSTRSAEHPRSVQ